MPYCHCGHQIEDFDDGDDVEWHHVNPATGEVVELERCENPRPEND